jgi:NitT/TauT family transport system substrate-binding protein
MKRIEWVGGIGAASLAVPASAAFAQPAAQTVTVGQNGPSSATWPMMVTQELGFFKRYGINVDVVVLQSTAAAAQQAIVGAIDLGLISSPQLIEAVQGGAKLKVYCNQMGTPAYSLVGLKTIKKYADLKGKTIVVGGVNDATRIFAEKMLASGGLKPQDYDEIYAGATTDRYAALKSGSVAAAILFPPWDFRAADEGYNILGSLPSVMPTFPYTGYIGRDDLAAKRPDALLGFAKGYLRGVRWLNDPANRARAVDILADRTRSTQSDAVKTYDAVIAKGRIFPSDGKMTVKMLSIVVETLGAIGVLKPPFPPLAGLFDNRFVDSASAQLAREPRA